MLALDDPLWLKLDHRGWVNGARYELDPSAPFVPDSLAYLRANPGDMSAFADLWPYLCSEGTTWPVALAAAPYFVSFAESVPSAQRIKYLTVLGLIETHRQPESAIPYASGQEVLDSYTGALNTALRMTAA